MLQLRNINKFLIYTSVLLFYGEIKRKTSHIYIFVGTSVGGHQFIYANLSPPLKNFYLGQPFLG